jgi:hypothetical protein
MHRALKLGHLLMKLTANFASIIGKMVSRNVTQLLETQENQKTKL